MYYNVGIVRKNISNNYIYKSDINLDIGQLVIINFNKKQTIGIILETLETSNYTGSITEITEVLQYNIPSSYIKFIKLFADYNLIPLGTALSLIVPFSIDNINKIPRKIKSIKPDKKREVILNIEQITLLRVYGIVLVNSTLHYCMALLAQVKLKYFWK